MKIEEHLAAESESRPCLDCGGIIYTGERCTDCAWVYCEKPRVGLAELTNYAADIIRALSSFCSNHAEEIAEEIASAYGRYR